MSQIFMDICAIDTHCKKCAVMWTIMELIGENPLISVTSLYNIEMSQCSSDVPILVNFPYIYFPHIFTELGCIV